MSNVIALAIPPRLRSQDERFRGLLQTFALNRRDEGDVFWLKENAELLNILECTGQVPGPEALAVHAAFYGDLMQRAEFFPQYYRFHLSMALDLEDLGLQGDTAEKLIDFALREGLADNELSDLQRMEARRLMARRGRMALPWDRGLEDRLRDFMDRAQSFVLPNKKAAYELTHIVFYLSEYGRRDPRLGDGARLSLIYAGLLAFLDLNADLLAEICIALVYAGETPPASWTSWLSRETQRFRLNEAENVSISDDYHEFLICNWHAAVTGGQPFRDATRGGRARFDRGARLAAPLRQMSEELYRMGQARSGDWGRMRDRVSDALSPDARLVLELAEASSPVFERFFAGFARTNLRGMLAS